MSYVFVKQQDKKDCGVACLAMILKHYGSDTLINELRDISGVTSNGVSALGMKQTLEKFHFKCRAIKGDISIFENEELLFPSIAHLINKDGSFHYIVIHEKKRNNLIIADPVIGIKEVSIEDFNSVWTGLLLLMEPNEEFVPHKVNKMNILCFMPLFLNNNFIFLSTSIISIGIFVTCVKIFFVAKGILQGVVLDDLRKNIPSQVISSIIFITLYFILKFINENLQVSFRQSLSQDIIKCLFSKLKELPDSFFSHRETENIFSKIPNIREVVLGLSAYINIIFNTIPMILFLLFMMSKHSFYLLLLSIVYVTIYVYFKKTYEMHLAKVNRKEIQKGIAFNKAAFETLNIIKEQKDRRYLQTDKLELCLEKFQKAGKKTQTLIILNKYLQILLVASNLLNIYFISVYIIDNGVLQLSQYIYYAVLSSYFLLYIDKLSMSLNKISKGNLASIDLFEILYL
ncbi:hypothetical protein LI951_12275 [Enterococcus sp. BWT-B8]|uniref:cysteine peptidase family C39 domain-containing protein n=1 Tax=Enterococcus sp. BWT-B8 TaxID=2885157 RepID=UPI001E4D2B9D|nr:cysteine peptidase family C39 domain-containing protein [Enterococcus sp. BWT-B8]MCB5952845.1 hypothetical protein [Enterococcus sp. BWT-B8]